MCAEEMAPGFATLVYIVCVLAVATIVLSPDDCPVTLRDQLPLPSDVVDPALVPFIVTAIALSAVAVPVIVNDELVTVAPFAGDVIDTVVAAITLWGINRMGKNRSKMRVVVVSFLNINR